MKVGIAVQSRFHAFDLARELQKQGALQKLISAYPYFKASEFGIARSCYRSLILTEIPARLGRRMPASIKKRFDFASWSQHAFDRLVAQSMADDLDVFVGWSGSCLESFFAAKARGAVTVIERGSSHIEVQYEILKKEYTDRGVPFKHFPQRIIDREKAGYEAADYIGVPSEFVKRSFLSKGFPEEKLLLNPYGVSLEDFSPSLTAQNDDVFRFIFCGGVSLRKGIPYLLEAFHGLQLPKAELMLVGHLADEIRPFLEKYENTPGLRVMGAFPQKELSKIYGQADVFVLPSLEEGLAMVQPQAMACALPVIHTFSTGGSNIVRDGVDGFCIKEGDVSSLQEKMLWCYENREATRQMGLNAAQQVESQFSWESYGRRAYQLYDGISR